MESVAAALNDLFTPMAIAVSTPAIISKPYNDLSDQGKSEIDKCFSIVNVILLSMEIINSFLSQFVQV